MFTEEVMKRFKNPQNTGELEDYNGLGEAGDPKCSDMIQIFIKFKDNKVVDAKFKVFGCPGAISTTDVFIDLIKGEKIVDALLITEEKISDALGGLPTEHMHCSHLPMEAFRKAVMDYQSK
ncbi:iron-sulfur cluster assembly scaffold protein [Candidatus Woesearchaeota archaeon]|nr:iron-sulfur cluster assembly scaffold protein [Candidatus Woesearchaeota archaeon]